MFNNQQHREGNVMKVKETTSKTGSGCNGGGSGFTTRNPGPGI